MHSWVIISLSILTAILPGTPGLAGFIGAMDVVVTTVAVSGAKPSQIVATDKPTSSSLRAGWHDALPVAQSTVSKH